MSNREVNKFKKRIAYEFEFIRTKNNSGVDLWDDLDDLRQDIIVEDVNEAVLKRKLTQDEAYALYMFWWEQFEQNISLTVRDSSAPSV